MDKKYKITLLLMVFILGFNFNVSIAGQISENFISEIKNRYKFNMNVLLTGEKIKPADSSQNPENDFLKLNDYTQTLMVRPDFSLSYKNLYLSVKPRIYLEYKQFKTGTQKGRDEKDIDVFINEYCIQYMVTDKLFFAFEREFLQWGPSFLSSPSNPFFLDNNKARPDYEGKGKEFATAIFIPNFSWTFSLLANIGNGILSDNYNDFEKIYAIKTDYSSNNGYASIILSFKDGDTAKERLGMLGGFTASDALLVYGEAGFQKGSDVLYPVSDNTNPFQYSMKQDHGNKNKIFSTLLVGSTYTFESGSTLTLEYLFNQAGYSDNTAADYYKLRQRAHDVYYDPGYIQGLSRQTLGQTMDNNLIFLRKNYFMAQYIQKDIFDIFDLTLRFVHCADDHSSRLLSYMDFYAGDNTRFFTSSTINLGNHETSFGSIFDYSLLIGIEYIF